LDGTDAGERRPPGRGAGGGGRGCAAAALLRRRAGTGLPVRDRGAPGAPGRMTLTSYDAALGAATRSGLRSVHDRADATRGSAGRGRPLVGVRPGRPAGDLGAGAGPGPAPQLTDGHRTGPAGPRRDPAVLPLVRPGSGRAPAAGARFRPDGTLATRAAGAGPPRGPAGVPARGGRRA